MTEHQRLFLTQALRGKAGARQPARRDKPHFHSRSPPLGEFLVVTVIALGVGVSVDAHGAACAPLGN